MEQKIYLLCYDIADEKRLYRVRKQSYPLALGGQKSALQLYVSKREASRVLQVLKSHVKEDEDRINIIQVYDAPLMLGKSLELSYDEGAIII